MTTLRLQSVLDDRLDMFCNLTNHQLRNALDPERGIAIVESEIAIRVALAQGMQPLALLLDERKLDAMSDVLAHLDNTVPVFVLPPIEAEKLTGYRVTRGALCAIRRPSLPTVMDLVASSHHLVVLEGITDTSNVGAVFRNAAALGADGVIVAPTCADPLSRRAVRVSMGNVFMVPWTRATSDVWPDGIMALLWDAGFARYALALSPTARPLGDVDLREPSRIALFFGSEGYGLSDAALNACDKHVVIPMYNGVDSLNVAASSAVAMWELFG